VKLLKRAWVRSAHRYVGLAIALWVVLAGLTGSVLSFHREIDQWLNPALFEVREPGRVMPTARWNDVLADIPVAGSLSWIDFPVTTRSPVAVAHFTTPDGAVDAYVDPSTGTLNGLRDPEATGLSRLAIVRTIYRLHSELLLGPVGLTIVGVLGLVLILMTVMGVYLWYPRGRGKSYPFRFVPRSRGIRLAYEGHRVGGIYAVVPLVLMAISGASFAFPDAYAAMLGTGTTAPKVAPAPAASFTPAAWPGLVDQVSRAYPDATIPGIVPAADGKAHAIFLRFPGEFNSYGSSRIVIDGTTGRVVDRVIAPDHPINHRAMELLFPLHSGEVAGPVGRALVLALGLLLVAVVVAALAVWAKRTLLRKPSKRS
jgi:uncharacterized iron-regulated membrane protein